MFIFQIIAMVFIKVVQKILDLMFLQSKEIIISNQCLLEIILGFVKVS